MEKDKAHRERPKAKGLKRGDSAAMWIVLLAGLGLLFYFYYLEAWQSVYSCQLDQVRYEQLKHVYKECLTYRASHGHWPTSKEFVGIIRKKWPPAEFPLTGPNRVEYYNPPKGGVLLRSYGHKEATKGWNLRLDDIYWEVDIRGQVHYRPITQ